jgi:putative Ca2+/H+ antiporter (TMEM165/GDT1 family)
MDSQTTIMLLGTGILLVIVASLGDRARRRAPLAWYAYVPWHGLIFAGTAAALFAAVHLYGLAGQGALG